MTVVTGGHVAVRDDTKQARVLRYLQILDAEAKLDPKHRELLMLACDILGQLIGLDCTSDDPRDHNGETCPIHEWLVEEDATPAQLGRRVQR